MRTVLFTLLVGLAVAACGTEPATGGDDGSGSGSDMTTPPDGAALFADTCSQCHGADGTGTKDGPGILSPVHPYATYVVRHGRNEMGFPAPMMAFDTTMLSDPELTAILDWLSSAPKPTTGPDLYGRFCVNCHGANGRSGRVGINIVTHVGELSSKVRLGHGGTSYGARTSYMPAWNATEITDADIAALRTYVSGL